MRNLDTLLAEALALPPEARAELAQRLAESLDPSPTPGSEDAWVREIARRIERVRAGTARTVSGEDALARARAKLAAERA